jgi:hypothetical protein
LEGTFYKQEFQKVNKTDSDVYRVEEVLWSRMRNKRKEYFVKWVRLVILIPGYQQKV